MANVLIVGINYRPEVTGIAPYTGALAEHLAASGHRTTVITGFAHYPGWRLEPNERRIRAAELLDGVRVLRRRHYVPGSQSAVKRAVYEGTFLAHGALSRPERPDAVFGVIPSLSGGMLARIYAARARAPYGLIFQDLMAPSASCAYELSAPVVFVLMGDGSQRAVLEAQAAGIERVRFMPLQPEDELPEILHAADVLLISERATVLDMSLPSKLTSYFAADRPIVGAVVPTGATAGEVLRSGAGIVVPSGHPDKLIEAVLQLQADQDLGEALGLAGQAYAASSLNGDHALARMDALLEQTLGRTISTASSG